MIIKKDTIKKVGYYVSEKKNKELACFQLPSLVSHDDITVKMMYVPFTKQTSTMTPENIDV